VNEEFVRTYSDHLKSKGCPLLSRRYARNALRNLFRWLLSKGLTLSDLTPATANDYLYSYVLKGVQKQAVRQILYQVRRFCRYAVERGLLPADPTIDISFNWLSHPGGYAAYRGPLRQIFDKPTESFDYLLPRWAPYWELYLLRLLDQKYDRVTLGRICFENRRFYQWLIDKKRTWQDMTPGLLWGYLCHVHRTFRLKNKHRMSIIYFRDHRNQIDGFLSFAFEQTGKTFRKPEPRPDSRVLPNTLLDQYVAFCRDHRGLKTHTWVARGRELLRFRAYLERHKIKRLHDVTIITMDNFFQTLARRMTLRSVAHIISTLRSFFQFLFLHNKYPHDLAADMTPPHRYSADRRPKYLPWTKIQPFLDSLQHSTLVEKRNYAMILLLAHHGLRPSEVARLKLSDIDWKGLSMLLHPRKNGITVQFPMTALSLDAVRDYLAVRPAIQYPEIFLTSEAPIEPLPAMSISNVVWCLLKARFGNSLPHYGPYVLRHSFAKALLDGGATLPEVGTMLGHKRINTTMIYSRINTHDLAEVADNYASLLP
jgi:site-specific recombinase XerD